MLDIQNILYLPKLGMRVLAIVDRKPAIQFNIRCKKPKPNIFVEGYRSTTTVFSIPFSIWVIGCKLLKNTWLQKNM